MKKVLALIGSPRKLGNCEIIAKEISRHISTLHELILLQHADLELLGKGHAAALVPFLAGQDAQKCRLAATVGAYQPVTATRIELQVDVFEQRFCAEVLLQVGDRDHGGDRSDRRWCAHLGAPGSHARRSQL